MVSTRGLKVDFTPGESVLCFEPDLTKARVLYNAKLLDIMRCKDSKGQNRIDYMVHFQGWNSTWDRVVPESFIIKNTERNRRLMRRLADIARHVKKNKSRMRRIDNILKEHFEVRPKFNSDSSSSPEEENDEEEEEDDVADDESADPDDDNNSDRNERLQDSESEDESREAIPLECTEPKQIELELPGNLRRKLEQDCIFINKKDKLILLPAEPNIITILEGYVKNFGVNILCATVEKQRPYTLRENRVEPPEKNIDLCKEMMDGLRVFFDFALPTILLYEAEREQYHRLTAARKPLVVHKINDESENAVQASKQQATCKQEPDSSHRMLRVSPRVIKKEADYSDDDDEGPPRRITRKAFQEEIRRSSLKSSESVKRTSENHELPESSQDNKRPRLESASESRNRRKSAVKGESNRNNSESRSKKVLLDRITPPPPLVLPGSVSSASSNADTPTSSMEQSLFRHREAAVNEIFSWKMLPDMEYDKVPSAPSLVYGAHHLLRLFVKLPEYMEQMPIPQGRLKVMIKHLEQFIQYLSNRANELLLDSVYVDMDESFGWVDLKREMED